MNLDPAFLRSPEGQLEVARKLLGDGLIRQDHFMFYAMWQATSGSYTVCSGSRRPDEVRANVDHVKKLINNFIAEVERRQAEAAQRIAEARRPKWNASN